MDTITISGKDYKVKPKVAKKEMVSKERDELEEELSRLEFEIAHTPVGYDFLWG